MVECIPVALAFIQRDETVLLTRRMPDAHQGGRWEFPGGKVQAGETFAAALRRELMEEIGISVVVEEELATASYRYPDRCVDLHLFRCTVSDGKPVARQVAALCWAPIDHLCEYAFPPANASLLAGLNLFSQNKGERPCPKA